MISKPAVVEIANRTWLINEFGMDTVYLLEGDSKALLIDTGTGTFEMMPVIRRLTEKPVMVVLTHGHVDHAGGMREFPEIWLHPDDFQMALDVTAESRAGYADCLAEMAGGLYDVSGDSVIVRNEVPEFHPLYEGEDIELGDRLVRVYETPGHTPGGLSFLDVRERILFSGDACNGNTLMSCHGKERPKSSISDLLRTAEKLNGLQQEFDRHYNGHVGYASDTSYIPQPKRLIQDCIDACKGLLDGTLEGEPASAGAAFVASGTLIARTPSMVIQYTKDQVK